MFLIVFYLFFPKGRTVYTILPAHVCIVANCDSRIFASIVLFTIINKYFKMDFHLFALHLSLKFSKLLWIFQAELHISFPNINKFLRYDRLSRFVLSII